MMTRRDFQLIAAALRAARPEHNDDEPAFNTITRRKQWAETVIAVDLALSTTNPNYLTERFLTACGFEGMDSRVENISREGAI